ncbi:hypothetical protein NOC27_957 [Nitrosococcus oceani AFC27]|nr:hypothetical protein NOC27_957 [Nitrosococcus oceani AFC27]
MQLLLYLLLWSRTMREHLEDLRHSPKAEELFAELLREAQVTFLG